MTDLDQQDAYSETETVARRDAALKRMLNTPPQPRTKSKKEKAQTVPDSPKHPSKPDQGS